MRLTVSDKSRLKKASGLLVAMMCIVLIPTISLAAGYGPARAPDTASFATDLAFYGGAFSTAVTASVNPTATMAVLAILGSIENAAVYSPDSAFLCNVADFLNGIPILREVGKLPIANPWAAVFLTLIAAALIVIHSFAESKMVSEETIDKLDKLVGYICTVSIALLPFVTTEALEADPPGVKGGALAVRTFHFIGAAKTSAPGWQTYILAGITVIAITIFYYCNYTCMDNWEVIVAAVPVKGTSLIWQIIKAFLHMILVLLQIFAPVVSFIVSIHLAVAGLFLFRILKRVAQYYKDIYVYTILRKIFKRNDPVPRVEKHVPKRLRKLYPTMEIAMSVYTFHGFARLAKRSRIWLIKDGDKVDLVYKRLIRKPYIVSWNDLREKHKNQPVYIEQCARFLRIRTEDRKLELIMSSRYKPETSMLSQLLDLKDFGPVKEEIKETRKSRRRLRRKKAAAETI
ncbi:MAG: hypothetical protein IKF09_06165 [Clostridiales bacterium]|nr:hypothetical protein [Clostridiales bacterium]